MPDGQEPVSVREFWWSAEVRAEVANGRRLLKLQVGPDDYPQRQDMRQCDHGQEPASGKHGWMSIWAVGPYIIHRIPFREVHLGRRTEPHDYFFVTTYDSVELALQVFASLSAGYDDEAELIRGYPLTYRHDDKVTVISTKRDSHVRNSIDDGYCEGRPGEGALGIVMCRARVDRENLWLVMTEQGVKAYHSAELASR